MKKILLSVLTLLAFAGSGTAQNLPSYVPANGLVGWWPFNGNANDESGNNNNGTVNGATLTTDRFGVANAAYNFNGLNQWIEVAPSSVLNIIQSVTISAWVKKNEFNQRFEALVAKDQSILSTQGINYKLQLSPNNDIGFYTSRGYSSTAFSDSIWSHFVGVSSNDSIKFYLDNNLIFSSGNQFNGNPLTTNDLPLTFGRLPYDEFDEPNTVGNERMYYSGILDDIAIYNRALTQQEITGLYQGANTTSNCLTLPSNLQQGLVGYWPFCGNANDESGNGHDGTVNGATLTNDRFGNLNSAYQFDGNDFISGNDSGFPSGNSDRTISFWATPSVVDNQFHMVFGYGTYSAFNLCSFGIHLLNNQYYYSTYSNELYVSDASPFVTKHFVITLKQGTYNIYSNGILVFTGVATTNTILNEYFFGRDSGGGFFKGILDDIGIWNRGLTQQEITQLYNQGICQTSITVTDTLLIHTGITSYNPVAYQNTLKVWPNPGNQDITLDAGNLSLMQGWKIKISNSLGQEVFPATLISQQQQVLDMSTWGGNGLYFLNLINPQGHITEVKKIVLAP